MQRSTVRAGLKPLSFRVLNRVTFALPLLLVIDGDWQPRRLVVLEFNSVEKAKAWRTSPEYAEAKKVRDTGARANMIVVEGV